MIDGNSRGIEGDTDGGSCAVDASADYPLHPPDLSPGADEAYLHTLNGGSRRSLVKVQPLWPVDTVHEAGPRDAFEDQSAFAVIV